jgi:hypothetical protein
MIIKKTIEFELQIDEDGKYGVKYPNDMELMFASMLISAETLEEKLKQGKEIKKGLSGKTKDDMGRQINLISKGLVAINAVVYPLLQAYPDYLKFMEEQKGT